MAAIERIGVEGWTELITSNFIALSVSDAPEDFRGQLTRCDLSRGITLTEVKTRPSRVRRTPRLVNSDGVDDVLFLVHQEGVGSVCQDQRRRHLNPGDGSLHVATCPYELLFPSSARVIVLQAPKRLLPPTESLPPTRRNTGFAGNSPAMRVFSAFARELLAVSDGLSERTREEMGGTAVDLLVSVLRGGVEADNVQRMGPDAVMRTMEAFIHTNLDDPELTAETVAAHHHVSLRYTQALFNRAGTAPAAYIRAERLNRALQALRDPRLGGLPVAAIGHRCGFPSADTFIRAFRREFGMTPGQWRRAALHDGVTTSQA